MTVRTAELRGGRSAARIIRGAAAAVGLAGGYLVWLATVMLVVAVFPVRAWAAVGVAAVLLLAAAAFWLARRCATPALRQVLWCSPVVPVLVCLYLTAVVVT